MNTHILPIRTLRIAGSPRLAALAALAAGLIAGTVATAAQLLLWWLAAAPLPETLYRDTRLAAAIVLPQTLVAADALSTWPGWIALLTATIIHLTLSALYAAAFFFLALRFRIKRPWLPLAGIAFGLALYVVNMYGLTAVYPWFALVRDGITIAAHSIFGLSLGLIVRANTRFIGPLLPF